MVSKIATLAVFLTSLNVVLSLSCHAGMNMSVGGIPAGYYWTPLPCDTEGMSCMMEEISIGLTDAQFTRK